MNSCPHTTGQRLSEGNPNTQSQGYTLMRRVPSSFSFASGQKQQSADKTYSQRKELIDFAA